MTIDPLASASSISIKALEQRYKRVFTLLKAAALRTADCLCEYKNMADNSIRREIETQNPFRELGKKWNARSRHTK